MVLAECPDWVDHYTDNTSYECDVCGHFFLTGTAEAVLKASGPQPDLSPWIRDHKERGAAPPELSNRNIEQIQESLPRYTVPEKLNILLTAISRKTRWPGEVIILNSGSDYPLAWAANNAEFEYLLNALCSQALIDIPVSTLLGIARISITPHGWERLDKLRNEILAANQVFVAMRFASEYEEAWERGIKPAVENAGYSAVRIDKLLHTDRIDARIMAEIHNSHFLIADASEPNPGVYFEAGYAIGLKRPVLWSCRDDRKDRLHFDTRQYPHVIWKTPNELSEKLFWLICGVVGKRK